MHRFLTRPLALFLLVLLVPVSAAEESWWTNVEKELERAEQTIEGWDEATTDIEDTEVLRARLVELRALGTDCVTTMEKDVQVNKDKIAALGEETDDEAPEIKAQRKQLEEEGKQIGQKVAICRLTQVGTGELLDEITAIRQKLISEQLTSRTTPVWETLPKLPAEIGSLLKTLGPVKLSLQTGWLWGLLLSLIALLPAGIVVGKLLKDYELEKADVPELHARTRIVGMYGRRLPWVMLFISLGATLAWVGNAFAAYPLIFAVALLTSPLIDYALCNERKRCPASVPVRIFWTLSLFGTAAMLVPGAFSEIETINVIVLRTLFLLLFFISAIWLVFRLATYREFVRYSGLRWPLILLFLTGPLAYVVGYQNFGIFFSRALFGSLMVLLLAWMTYRTLIQVLRPVSMKTSESEATDAEFDRFSLRRLVLLASISIFSILVVQRLWRITPRDTSSLSDRLSQPFEIGTITLVPSRLIVGLLIALGFWIVARALQRSATNLLQARDPASRGARQSVITLLAYVIITLGLLFGLSAAGLELSNLAIIAGALSVGIGFGLQNIVSNFVSGIILLFERPIRPGDWIRVGTTEGIVRKVRIRSTIIETFDRAEVLVPNSDLLSNQVINMTLTDGIGRLTIPVGVAYGSNTKKVREVMLRVAREHPQVIQSDPRVVPPRVLFRDFADSALLFELRCFVKNVDYRLIVESDLRYAIDDAFRAEKIEIPFPQRVVYMHKVPGEQAAES